MTATRRQGEALEYFCGGLREMTTEMQKEMKREMKIEMKREIGNGARGNIYHLPPQGAVARLDEVVVTFGLGQRDLCADALWP